MRQVTWCWLVLLLAVPFRASGAQDISNVPCDQVHAIARASNATSLAVLAKEKQNAGSSYRAEVVFAARSFELQPRNKSAATFLLNLIPHENAQHTIVMTLGDSLCDEQSVTEMKSLGSLGDRLPHDLARAVLLVPDKLPSYVSYAPISVQDPHSDYAVQMQPVCRAKHSEFTRAVEELPSDKQEWFVKHIFNPDGCHALALPEAE